MADDTKSENITPATKADPKEIKVLEAGLKTAYKEGKFDELKKQAEALRKLDPENRLATRLLEKAEAVKAAKLKKENAKKVKDLVKQMKAAFRAGQLMDLAKIAGEIKKIDPENKKVKKIEDRIDKAKAAMDAQLNKEKVKVLTETAKGLLNLGKLDDAAKKANEILEVEWGNGVATKILSKVAKEKNVDVKNLITVAPPQEKGKEDAISHAAKNEALEAAPKKEGFFSRLFGKKEKTEEVKAEEKKPEAAMPAHTGMATVSGISKPVAAPEKSPAVTGATEPKPAEDNKEKISALEAGLKEAQKDNLVPAIRSAIEDLKKIDPENKAALKAEEKLEKEKIALEEKANKEKIKGLSKEIKELMKNEEWQKAKDKITALFEVEKENKFGQKMLKKIEKASQESEPVKTEAPARPGEKHTPENDSEKKSVFSSMFSKKEPESSQDKNPAPPAPAVPSVTPAPAKEAPVKAEAAKIPAVNPAPAVQQAPVAPAVKPAAPAEPATESVMSVPLTPLKPAAEKPAPKPVKSPVGEAPKGNIFTKLFKSEDKGKQPNESIIETIVAQTEEAKKEKTVKREAKKKEEVPGSGFVKMSSTFMKFAIAFIVISAGFFYVTNIDKQNRVMAMFGGRENNALQLKLAAEEVEGKKEEEKAIKKEIKRYSEGYENENKKVIEKIIENRLNWPDLIKKLNEVTESVYEKNALAQYVQYNNYSYDVNSGQLTVSGTLSDPQGRNLTKLAELEEAFMYYPKDKNDPEDETLPYFYNMQGFNSYAKTFNKTTGRFTSNFSLSLATKKKPKK